MKYYLILLLAAGPAWAQQDYAQNRFHMTQDGKNMTANDFDNWLQNQGLDIVNGKGVRKVVNGATSFSSLVPESNTTTMIRNGDTASRMNGSGQTSNNLPAHNSPAHNSPLTITPPVTQTFQGGARGRIVTFAED